MKLIAYTRLDNSLHSSQEVARIKAFAVVVHGAPKKGMAVVVSISLALASKAEGH